MVQDRCELDVAYFCCVVKCFFNGLLWHFLFCFSCCFCFVVLTRFGSVVLHTFCCVCTTFVGVPGCYRYQINYALFAVSFCVCLGENLTHFCCFVLYQCLCTDLGTRIITFCSLFPLTPLPPLLLAGSYDRFLALCVFGLSFLRVLHIFEVSLVTLFLLLPV